MTTPAPDRAARLATRIGSFPLANPVICGSGEHVMTTAGIRAALATGVAGVIAKSTNESPLAARQLDHTDYALLRPDGGTSAWPAADAAVSLEDSFLGRSGLIDRTPDDWFAEIALLDGEAQRSLQFVAASVVLGQPGAAAELAGLAAAKGIRVFELNIGAPHGKEAAPGAVTVETDPNRLLRIVQDVRAAFRGALWVKLSGLSDNVVPLARAAREGGADAVGLTGRFMAFMPDLDTLRPVLGTSAAYGGRWAVPITCRWLALARRDLGKDFPLLGTNGARTGTDVARFLLAGATAVEMTSLVFQHGFAALRHVVDELGAWLEQKDLDARSSIGKAADALQGYTEQPARPGHWRRFTPHDTAL